MPVEGKFPAFKITKKFEYFKAGEANNYTLLPEMGVVTHIPRHVCEAAATAKCGEFVEAKTPAKKSATT